MQTNSYSRDRDPSEEVWCTECGYTGESKIEKEINGDNSKMILTCPCCYAVENITFRYQNGYYEDIEFIDNVLLSADCEEAYSFIERLEKVNERVDSQLYDSELTEQILRKLCFEELEHLVVTVFKRHQNKCLPDLTVVVSSDPNTVDNCICYLDELRDHKYHPSPLFEVISLEDFINQSGDKLKIEDRRGMHQSTVLRQNSKNPEQFWVKRIGNLHRDILLERGSMDNPNDFESLLPYRSAQAYWSTSHQSG